MGSSLPLISGFFDPVDLGSESREQSLEVLSDSEGSPYLLYRSCQNGRLTVLKCLRESYRGNPLYEELLKKEFEIGSSLSHPNIREYYSYFTSSALGSCVEMEWVDGCTLEELLEECRGDKELCDRIASQMLEAVRFMHLKQTVHRDLKPSNILVTRKGRNVKLIDFSLSDSESHLLLKSNAGTALYASPEQLGGGECDYRSDIYSLGVILSQMSSRRSYRSVSRRCTRKEPLKRFQNIDQLSKALFEARLPLWAIVCCVAGLIVAACASVYILSPSSSEDSELSPQTIDSIFREATRMLEPSATELPED